MFSKNTNWMVRLAAFALVAVLALPAVTVADSQGRGKGRDKRSKKEEKFRNGHDARDGRWDGRGQRRNRDNRDDDYDNRDDDYYDNDDDNYRRRRNRDRDRDGINDGREIRQVAVNNGYQEGYEAGREDRDDGNRYDFRDEGDYRDASNGYRSEYGNREAYRRYFREGFQRGYNDGYQGRGTRRTGGIGDILGGIFN